MVEVAVCFSFRYPRKAALHDCLLVLIAYTFLDQSGSDRDDGSVEYGKYQQQLLLFCVVVAAAVVVVFVIVRMIEHEHGRLTRSSSSPPSRHGKLPFRASGWNDEICVSPSDRRWYGRHGWLRQCACRDGRRVLPSMSFANSCLGCSKMLQAFNNHKPSALIS